MATLADRPGRLADWLADRWERRPWRAAIRWTVGMGVVLVVVVALTEHFGWGILPPGSS